MGKKRHIAAFDFDGTLTTKDSLLEFLLFAKGRRATIAGILLFLPLMVLMKLRLYDHSRCKERLLSFFFKGMRHEDFKRLGEEFAHRYSEFMRPETNERLRKHLANGDTVYIISASIDEWVRPIGMSLGVKDVLCTRMEVDGKGLLTGRFSTPNCHGKEKVNRLLAAEPQRDGYTLHAYGDSGGDEQMFAFADYSYKIRGKK